MPVVAQLKQQNAHQGRKRRFCRCPGSCARRISFALVFAAIAFAAPSFVRANELSGIARVLDGDTIAINERRIRLYGIDAPETDQACLDAKGERWNCGIAARDGLSSHVAGRIVTCEVLGKDWHRRTLAVLLNGWRKPECLARAAGTGARVCRIFS